MGNGVGPEKGANGVPAGGIAPPGTSLVPGGFNSPDFRTQYDAARFFVIKSYSEDDVHKSIKYGVWSSTQQGNRRRGPRGRGCPKPLGEGGGGGSQGGRQAPCLPLLLGMGLMPLNLHGPELEWHASGTWVSSIYLWSISLSPVCTQIQGKEASLDSFVLLCSGSVQVNASGQFCGVAEMTSPVDFNRNADFWQQDKWMGQFQVTWHVVKDVPNGNFRHIIIPLNENKPATNSRDTQEVRPRRPPLTLPCPLRSAPLEPATHSSPVRHQSLCTRSLTPSQGTITCFFSRAFDSLPTHHTLLMSPGPDEAGPGHAGHLQALLREHVHPRGLWVLRLAPDRPAGAEGAPGAAGRRAHRGARAQGGRGDRGTPAGASAPHGPGGRQRGPHQNQQHRGMGRQRPQWDKNVSVGQGEEGTVGGMGRGDERSDMQGAGVAHSFLATYCRQGLEVHCPFIQRG